MLQINGFSTYMGVTSVFKISKLLNSFLNICMGVTPVFKSNTILNAVIYCNTEEHSAPCRIKVSKHIWASLQSSKEINY